MIVDDSDEDDGVRVDAAIEKPRFVSRSLVLVDSNCHWCIGQSASPSVDASSSSSASASSGLASSNLPMVSVVSSLVDGDNFGFYDDPSGAGHLLAVVVHATVTAVGVLLCWLSVGVLLCWLSVQMECCS